MRHVRGSLFIDYVRMVRSHQTADWSRYLSPDDRALLERRVAIHGWYPMETFERLGLGILEVVAGRDLDVVRVFGRQTVDGLVALHRELVVADEPRDSLMRFDVLRQTLFDFDAATIARIDDAEVRVRLSYGMSAAAEEAACYQTMGFFERLVELAGGRDVQSHFARRSWHGEDATVLVVKWSPPLGKAPRSRQA